MSSKGMSMRNPSGYTDMTAHDAVCAVMQEESADGRANLLIKTLKHVVSLSGFHLLERIEIADDRTGREYR